MLGEYFRIAGRALTAHKMRSSLTVTSITIGAFSIVLMSSLAESGLQTLMKNVEELGGARIVMIYPKQPERMERKASNSVKGISPEDRELLDAALPHVAERTVFSSYLDSQDVASELGKRAQPDLVASDADFFHTFRLSLAKGREFTEDENLRHARVCVVSYDVAKSLWEGDAVGHWLTVDGIRCQVVGQLSEPHRFGMNFGFDWSNFVAVPLHTAAERHPNVLSQAGMYLKTTHLEHNDIVKRIANALLSERHHGVDDFQILDFSGVMEQFNGIFAVMKAIVGFLAGIALLVGGIGVMNMMLVSVSERVREIGIRKALGANPRNISGQFLCEAALLTTAGGTAGVAGGVALASLANVVITKLQPVWISAISSNAVLLALFVSIGTGVFFGVFPAVRAGRLSAIAAMRQ